MSVIYVSGKSLGEKIEKFMNEVWKKVFELERKYKPPINLVNPVHTFYPRDNPTLGIYDFKIALAILSSNKEAINEFNTYARLLVNKTSGLEEVTKEEFEK